MAKTPKTDEQIIDKTVDKTPQSELNKLFAQGKAHYDKGEYDEAEKLWEKVAELGDDNAAVALTWIATKCQPDFEIEEGVLVKYNGRGGDVVIPDGVTSIGNNAFFGCEELTSITIPNSVTNIGDSAFYYCKSLTSIEIPNSVSSLGSRTFGSCSSLESISVVRNNPKYHSVCNCIIETETKKLVVGCKNSVIPPNGSVTSIGDYAFRGCTGLTSITIPNSVTSIGESSFEGCSGLTSVTIPNSVASIEDSAFSYCKSLMSITIPNRVTNIGSRTFEYCSGLKSIEISNSVTNIGECAFGWCKELTVIKFGGKKDEWKKIEKKADWNKEMGYYIVICTDGAINNY